MTSRQNHPNNAPGAPMIFPVWVENLQIKYMNPVIAPLAKHLPGFSVVTHRGRKSGTPYETTVSSFRKGNVLAAGEADIRVSGKDLHVVNPRVLPVGTVDPTLPRIAQLVAKRSAVFVADIAG